jgi:hypothetical protein
VTNSPATHSWRLPLTTAFLSLLPLIWCHVDFAQLFYFEDELDLIDLRDRLGFATWTIRPFAENFVPLFKLSWGGIIELCHGSYFTLLVILWVNHALNTALLTRLLQRVGLSAQAAAIGALLFGLNSINLETLGWSVQWSAVQSLTFLILGLLTIAHNSQLDSASSRLQLVLCALASPLCFSRGVLTGPTLACALLLADGALTLKPSRLLTATCAILPAIFVGLVIAFNASGNHQHINGHITAIIAYAWHYFAGSPLYPWLVGGEMTEGAEFFWGAIKLIIISSALIKSRGPLRYILAALAIFDLGNALLLGIGRYHTGLSTALSSRYQYAALFCLLPFGAALLDLAKRNLRRYFPHPAMITAVWIIAGVLIAWSAYRWPAEIHHWQTWRGSQIREDLSLPPHLAPPNLARLPWQSNERTRELVEKYELH